MQKKKFYLKDFAPGIKRLLIALILVCWQYATVFGQSSVRLSGFILDNETGDPVSGAVISVINQPFGTLSDEGGGFTLENIPEGVYNLLIEHMGYRSEQIEQMYIAGDQPKHITVRLKHQPLEADSVRVFPGESLFQRETAGVRTVLDREAIQTYGRSGLPELLQQVGGVQLESTGNGGNNISIRIHGGSSSQVLVLLDGQRLNSPQTGTVDLGMIPLESIQEIEIIRQGNTAVYGNNAFDGIIHFKTRKKLLKNSVSVSSSVGSFSSASGELRAELNVYGTRSIVSYHQDYSANNYKYSHEGERLIRENAWHRSRKFFTKLNLESPRHNLNLLFNLHQGNYGLPSSYYEEMLHYDARASSDFTSLQLNHEWYIHPEVYIRNMAGYHAADQIFDNENDPSGFTRYKSRQLNRTTELKSEIFWQPQPHIQTRSGVAFLQENLKGENLLYPLQSIGKKNRETYSIYGSLEWELPLLKPVFTMNSIRIAGRYEKYFDLPPRFYPYAGFSLIPGPIQFLTLSASWARVIRYPDFNSLFWKGDARSRGNPALLPERKAQWNISAGLDFSAPYSPVLHAYFYSEQIEDLIFWHRNVQGIWEPRNEARTARKGMDLQLNQPVWKERINWQISYSTIDARNKSTEPNRQGKKIVFVPESSVSSALNLRFSRIRMTVMYRYVSERQVTAANTGIPLSPYEIWDLLLGYRWAVAGLDLQVNGGVRNLTESSYELIRGYPMPGRQFHVMVSISYVLG